jgi:hypothetical protein
MFLREGARRFSAAHPLAHSGDAIHAPLLIDSSPLRMTRGRAFYLLVLAAFR